MSELKLSLNESCREWFRICWLPEQASPPCSQVAPTVEATSLPLRGAGMQNMSKWWPKGRGRSWEEGAALPVCPHCPPTSGSFLRTSLLPWQWPIPLPTHAKKCPLFRPPPRIASYAMLSARPLPWHSTVNPASSILCTAEGQVLAIGTVTSWPYNLSAQTHSYSTSHLLPAIIKTTFL